MNILFSNDSVVDHVINFEETIPKIKRASRFISTLVRSSHTTSHGLVSTLGDLTGSLMHFIPILSPTEVQDHLGSSQFEGGEDLKSCSKEKFLEEGILTSMFPNFWEEPKTITCVRRSRFYLGDLAYHLIGSTPSCKLWYLSFIFTWEATTSYESTKGLPSIKL